MFPLKICQDSDPYWIGSSPGTLFSSKTRPLRHRGLKFLAPELPRSSLEEKFFMCRFKAFPLTKNHSENEKKSFRDVHLRVGADDQPMTHGPLEIATGPRARLGFSVLTQAGGPFMTRVALAFTLSSWISGIYPLVI